MLIAFPSFKLLYLMDEITDPSLSVLAEGHQWYWNYEYPDFLNSDGDFVEFDSYLVPETWLGLIWLTGEEDDIPFWGGSSVSFPGITGDEWPVPGRRCPACLERGDTVWVIPGKCCPICGTPVN